MWMTLLLALAVLCAIPAANAQGKPAEAKAKYQLVVDKRKTYDDGKIAQEKIRKIEAQGQ